MPKNYKDTIRAMLWLVAGAGIALSLASFAQLNFAGAFAAALCAAVVGATLWIEQEGEG